MKIQVAHCVPTSNGTLSTKFQRRILDNFAHNFGWPTERESPFRFYSVQWGDFKCYMLQFASKMFVFFSSLCRKNKGRQTDAHILQPKNKSVVIGDTTLFIVVVVLLPHIKSTSTRRLWQLWRGSSWTLPSNCGSHNFHAPQTTHQARVVCKL